MFYLFSDDDCSRSDRFGVKGQKILLRDLKFRMCSNNSLEVSFEIEFKKKIVKFFHYFVPRTLVPGTVVPRTAVPGTVPQTIVLRTVVP